MTLQEYFCKMLMDRGMLPNAATRVMDLAKADKYNQAMSGRWDDESEGYPPEFLVAVWDSVRITALNYLKENMPKAWYIRAFEE